MIPARDVNQDASAYGYGTADLGHHHAYLLPVVERIIAEQNLAREKRRVFDLGCGNGSVGAFLHRKGYEVTGVDPSEDGIERGNAAHPYLNLRVGSCYDDLATEYGQFPIVVSLEVVEHVYSPKKYAHTLYALVEAGGMAIVSTPYHGYWKNLALSIANHWDAHQSPLWEHGHIKFWSRNTLSKLLLDSGFSSVNFIRVGRVPALAKSMIAMATKDEKSGS